MSTDIADSLDSDRGARVANTSATNAWSDMHDDQFRAERLEPTVASASKSE